MEISKLEVDNHRMNKKIFEYLVKEELKFDINSCKWNIHYWRKKIINKIWWKPSSHIHPHNDDEEEALDLRTNPFQEGGWWKRPKPMIEKAQAQAQIQVQVSAQAQQIEDMGQLSIIGCLSFVITFEYF